MELASEEVFRRPEGYLIHTYVSNYQYVFLKETAAAQRMSVEGMLTAAAELLVGTDDDGSGYHIPENLGRIADSVLGIKGSTLKDFRRQCLVSIRRTPSARSVSPPSWRGMASPPPVSSCAAWSSSFWRHGTSFTEKK